MIYPNIQNAFYDQSLQRDGWSFNCISVSGGLFGWGSGQTVEEVLTMTAEEVAATVRARLLPKLTGVVAPILILDAENPMNLAGLHGWPFNMMAQVAWAFDMRARVIREVLAEAGIHDATLLAWVRGRSWQHRPEILDNESLITLGKLRDLGAFRSVEGCAYRCYPICDPSDPKWVRLENVVKNNHNAAATIFGRESFLLPQFSWWTHPGFHPLHEAMDEMTSLGLAVAGRCGIWSAGPWMTFRTAAGAGNTQAAGKGLV